MLGIRTERPRNWKHNFLNETNLEIKMSKASVTKYKRAKKCWLCKKKIKLDDIKLGDHCYLTGIYGGAEHQ